MVFTQGFISWKKTQASKRGKICFVKCSLLIKCMVEQKYRVILENYQYGYRRLGRGYLHFPIGSLELNCALPGASAG